MDSVNTGVWRYGRPTMTGISSSIRERRTARRLKLAMFTSMWVLGNASGSQRQRSRLASIWRNRS